MQHLALKLNHMQNERGEITKLSKFNLHKKKVFFLLNLVQKLKKNGTENLLNYLVINILGV